MAELILEHSTVIRTAEGEAYTPATFGQEREGTWIGWIEFVPADRRQRRLRTDRETTQSNRQALEYWATGLEVVYFEGAFQRARLVAA